jgi:hypothetical protein
MTQTMASDCTETIPASLRELVNGELTDGETIQWIDQPVPVIFPKGTLLQCMLGVFLTVLGIGFICAGCGMLHLIGIPDLDKEGRNISFGSSITCLFFGPVTLSVWLSERREVKYTVYVITDRRVMMVRKKSFGSGALQITSYSPADSWYVSCEENDDGTGNLYFLTKLTGVTYVSLRTLGFDNIRNVREVERLIQKLKGAAE